MSISSAVTVVEVDVVVCGLDGGGDFDGVVVVVVVVVVDDGVVDWTDEVEGDGEVEDVVVEVPHFLGFGAVGGGTRCDGLESAETDSCIERIVNERTQEHFLSDCSCLCLSASIQDFTCV